MSGFLSRIQEKYVSAAGEPTPEKRSEIASKVQVWLEKDSGLRKFVIKQILPYLEKAVSAYTNVADKAQADKKLVKDLSRKFKIDELTSQLAIHQVITYMHAAIYAQIPKRELAVYLKEIASLKKKVGN